MSRAVLAVAGGRKTQSIVDTCTSCTPERRILVLGYTTASQDELAERIRAGGGRTDRIEVMGWFAFLLQHLVRPYLPRRFANRRLTGLNFHGEPPQGYYATGDDRFLDPDGGAYKLHLAKLAHDVMQASGGSAIDRLEHIYDEIFVDEAQDLGGWDLVILELLLESKLSITIVGDMRQALLSTNIRDPKYKKYRREQIFDWFTLMQDRGLLELEQAPITYRSNQTIASFSDSIFHSDLGYEATISRSDETSVHSGLFVVAESEVSAYIREYQPLCLRHSSASGKHLDLPFTTFGMAKGRTVDHVLIFPTANTRKFLADRQALSGGAACSLYIGVTRAKHSLAFITDDVPADFQRWNRT